MTLPVPIEIGGFTPWQYGQELLDQLEQIVVPLPDERYAQLGGQVIACESLIVASTGIQAQEVLDTPRCDVVQVATYDITLARECANVSNDDGTNNPEAIVDVSAQIDQDADALWRWAQGLEYFWTKTFDVSWVITGGLAITTLTLTVGVP